MLDLRPHLPGDPVLLTHHLCPQPPILSLYFLLPDLTLLLCFMCVESSRPYTHTLTVVSSSCESLAGFSFFLPFGDLELLQVFSYTYNSFPLSGLPLSAPPPSSVPWKFSP